MKKEVYRIYKNDFLFVLLDDGTRITVNLSDSSMIIDAPVYVIDNPNIKSV